MFGDPRLRLPDRPTKSPLFTLMQMPRFTIDETPIAGVKKIGRTIVGDHRGHFSRLFCREELVLAGWRGSVAQVNFSCTETRGTVRGLHFQFPPTAEMKLVSCTRGEIWDVVVDLRRGSPTFLGWYAEVLSWENAIALLIPEGVAHGFQALQDKCEVIYCHSAAYVPSAEGGCRFDDPAIGISWPLPPINQSPRDRSHPLLTPEFAGVEVEL